MKIPPKHTFSRIHALSKCIASVTLASVSMFATASQLGAAPVTYRFEATVGALPSFNSDVGLPFTLEEGSVIDGVMTFDPDLGNTPVGNSATSAQPFAIELSFDGFSFGTQAFLTTVINNSMILDGPLAGPADFITVRCSSGSCSPNPFTLPGSPPLSLGINMQFSGSSSLLQTPELPNNVSAWNGFTIERSLRIGFATTAGNGALYDAVISPFTVVPEPSATYILLFTPLAWSIFRQRRRGERQDEAL